MSKDKPSSMNYYSQDAAEEYVEYLGCWKYPNPAAMKGRQDLGEYRACLERLLRVNRGRTDRVGVWETAAAEAALGRLK